MNIDFTFLNMPFSIINTTSKGIVAMNLKENEEWFFNNGLVKRYKLLDKPEPTQLQLF